MAKITYATIYTEGLQDDGAAASFANALKALRDRTDPIVCPHRIEGAEYTDGDAFERVDPCNPQKVVSKAWSADNEMISRAIESARAAAGEWRSVSWEDRVEIVQKVADRVRDSRDELAGLLGLECGKTRADAIAEVEECIVIIDLFCKQIRDNNGFVVEHQAPTDQSNATVVQVPYGVFGVIAPFNFPFAIPIAMAAAALITGNTVVVKPSAITPACGDALVKLFDDIGLPPGAVNCVHGGAETGEALSESELDGLVFTGSAEVGLGLANRFTQPPFTRPVIAEMGGKNPAIVTGESADLDVAARAVARSAFGMSGQKCNACSRVVVTDDIYDDFMERLISATAEIKVGDPLAEGVVTGPLISDRSLERFQEAAEMATNEGKIVAGGKAVEGDGFYAEPTVVDSLPKGHYLTREELFLPFLTAVRVSDLDEALDEANAVRYGLSAGIFSADKAEQERFLDEIEAGIVFVNNPGGATTGVWPGSQTMAGWKGSGTSGKGGFGPWYLHQFVREQSQTRFN